MLPFGPNILIVLDGFQYLLVLVGGYGGMGDGGEEGVFMYLMYRVLCLFCFPFFLLCVHGEQNRLWNNRITGTIHIYSFLFFLLLS